jgi:hypothetical protein
MLANGADIKLPLLQISTDGVDIVLSVPLILQLENGLSPHCNTTLTFASTEPAQPLASSNVSMEK